MSEVSDTARRAGQDGRLLLWVCRRYDMRDHSEPHDLADPAEVVASYSKDKPTADDSLLASTFWEAAWVEGARSQFLRLYSELQRNGPVRRPVVVLSRAEDSGARIQSSEFFPVAFVNGVAALPNGWSGTMVSMPVPGGAPAGEYVFMCAAFPAGSAPGRSGQIGDIDEEILVLY